MIHSDWPEVMAKRDAELKAVLNKNSVIWEVGGYLGDWAQYASDMFGSQIHVYEPVFCSELYKRFDGVLNIHVHNYGLERANYDTKIYKDGDASSLYGVETKAGAAEVNLADVLIEIMKFSKVDFMQLNCECGEYGILDKLLAYPTQLLKIKRLRIQFHKHSAIPEVKRDWIIQEIQRLGYRSVYSIPFYWEEWELVE